MDPNIRHDLLRLGQLDQVHGRRIAALPARSAFQLRFQLPDERIPRPTEGSRSRAPIGGDGYVTASASGQVDVQR